MMGSTDWAFMKKFEIPQLDRPSENYLTRWRIIQTPWFGVYVHRMDGPDSRATLHDHPWNFLSIVLKGGYVERLETTFPNADGTIGTRHRFVTRFNAKKAEGLHSIRRLLRVPTWTLMLVGRRRRIWGYVDDDGTWTRFDEHLHSEEFDRAMKIRKLGLAEYRRQLRDNCGCDHGWVDEVGSRYRVRHADCAWRK